MDLLTNNPGLQHLAEEVFMNLDMCHLEKCSRVNETWKNILANLPYLWLQKCIGKGQMKTFKGSWKKAIDLTISKTHLIGNISQYLRGNFFNCVSDCDYNPMCWMVRFWRIDLETIELLASSFENPNTPCAGSGVCQFGDVAFFAGCTPIRLAAVNEYDDIIKVLVPLSEHAHGTLGTTPIEVATIQRRVYIVKLLEET